MTASSARGWSLALLCGFVLLTPGCSWGTAVYEVTATSEVGTEAIVEQQIRFVHVDTLTVLGADVYRGEAAGFFAAHVDESGPVVTYDRMAEDQLGALGLAPVFSLWGEYGLWLLIGFLVLVGIGANMDDEAEDALSAQGGLLEAQVILFLFTAFVDQDLDEAVMTVVLRKVKKYSPKVDDDVLGQILKLSLAKLNAFQGETGAQRTAFFDSQVAVVKAHCDKDQLAGIRQDLYDLVAADGEVTDPEQDWLDLIQRSFEPPDEPANPS